MIAILASVSYGCATFLDPTLSTFSESWAAGYSLTRVFAMFVVILALSAIINIFSSHLLAVINNISVWWHVVGAAAVILILILLPKRHASFSDVFATTVNNTGMSNGDKGFGWLIFVLPIAAILTQYTITGYDASAHLSEETKSLRDQEQARLTDGAFAEAVRLLAKHRVSLDRLASALLQKETLGREEVLELLEGVLPESHASETVGTPQVVAGDSTAFAG